MSLEGETKLKYPEETTQTVTQAQIPSSRTQQLSGGNAEHKEMEKISCEKGAKKKLICTDGERGSYWDPGIEGVKL